MNVELKHGVNGVGLKLHYSKKKRIDENIHEGNFLVFKTYILQMYISSDSDLSFLYS